MMFKRTFIHLPPARYRQPVVLVCGDALAELFGEPVAGQASIRLTGQGCYIAVPEIQDLPQVITDLLHERPQWCTRLSVMLVSNPQAHVDHATLQARLRILDYTLKRLRRQGTGLPLLLVSYLHSHCLAHARPYSQAHSLQGSPWFVWQGGAATAQVHEAGACSTPTDWQRQTTDPTVCAQRLRLCLQLNSAAAWLGETLQPTLKTLQTPVAWAIVPVVELNRQVPGNLWQRWLQARTAMTEPDPVATATALPCLPLADPLLHLLPECRAPGPTLRMLLRSLWLGTLAGLAAMLLSAWQNTALLRQVGDDLQRYNALPVTGQHDQPGFARREQALTTLRGHAERLERYHQYGAPLTLRLGLYRGERLRTALQEVLALYRPPEPPVPVADVIRLDSLSLFDTGSARLKPESTKVLISALVGIKARPGWLIVIAGHTDAIGDTRSNLHLSRARAAAVRDWMQRMGDIGDDCFAVQGFGASQPIAHNGNETGRAANRRVDIRLVPEARACQPAAGAPATPVAQRDIQ